MNFLTELKYAAAVEIIKFVILVRPDIGYTWQPLQPYEWDLSLKGRLRLSTELQILNGKLSRKLYRYKVSLVTDLQYFIRI